MSSGYVYFAHAPHLELVKIGWSTQPIARMYTVLAEVRSSLRLAGALLGARLEERLEQQRFAHLWYGGEWFLEDQEILAYASGLPAIAALPLQDVPYRGAQEPRAPDFQSAWRRWAPQPGPCWSRRARERSFREYMAKHEAESA